MGDPALLSRVSRQRRERLIVARRDDQGVLGAMDGASRRPPAEPALPQDPAGRQLDALGVPGRTTLVPLLGVDEDAAAGDIDRRRGVNAGVDAATPEDRAAVHVDARQSAVIARIDDALPSALQQLNDAFLRLIDAGHGPLNVAAFEIVLP